MQVLELALPVPITVRRMNKTMNVETAESVGTNLIGSSFTADIAVYRNGYQ
jgi:hypothetical protein